MNIEQIELNYISVTNDRLEFISIVFYKYIKNIALKSTNEVGGGLYMPAILNSSLL